MRVADASPGGFRRRGAGKAESQVPGGETRTHRGAVAWVTREFRIASPLQRWTDIGITATAAA